MTNRERLVLHTGSGSSSRVRRVRARRCIRFSLGAHGRAVLAVILAAATPAPLRHDSEGRCARRPWTSESTISLEHRWHKSALTAPLCRSPFSKVFLALSSCLTKHRILETLLGVTAV